MEGSAGQASPLCDTDGLSRDSRTRVGVTYLRNCRARLLVAYHAGRVYSSRGELCRLSLGKGAF